MSSFRGPPTDAFWAGEFVAGQNRKSVVCWRVQKQVCSDGLMEIRTRNRFYPPLFIPRVAVRRAEEFWEYWVFVDSADIE
jgi:hypothetical protein